LFQSFLVEGYSVSVSPFNVHRVASEIHNFSISLCNHRVQQFLNFFSVNPIICKSGELSCISCFCPACIYLYSRIMWLRYLKNPRCLSISGGIRLLKLEIQIQIARSTVLLTRGVTVKNTGKFRVSFIPLTLSPMR